MDKPKSRGGKRLNAGRKPIDNNDKKHTRSIMLTDDEYRKLTEIAEKKGITRSMLIVKWINGEKISES